jgi:hypothetical protein
MEVKIGVQNTPRELIVDTAEGADEIEERLASAVVEGGTFSLVDTRGRRVVVPARGIAYLEIGSGTTGQVGFRG